MFLHSLFFFSLKVVCSRKIYRSQSKHGVKQGPRVSHFFLFVIPYSVSLRISVTSFAIVLQKYLIGTA